ncbi:Fumarate hydratase class II [Planctomycetes bacterium Pan216]|uniref:Fumarate hydratase class II n=1 Tax=Kolteria novifilia TaxID=2527975 RepID=A0A518B6X8_9BACT|nr:Fumarate hydratase class II [Planctomycetes bacterium Pan216]
MNETRTERDSMGEMTIPADAYYGAQTGRAVENFPISGKTMPPRFIRGVALIKLCAARVNADLGYLEDMENQLIQKAAAEVIEGKLDDQFVVDVFQTGSGTSTNMNVNEVIASRANEMATGERGGRSPVHPNDHVNRGQSSNDVIPTALHLSTLEAIERTTVPGLEHLLEALEAKATELDDVIKIGRTHLQDAVPIRLGQEFSGYATQVRHGIERLKATLPRLSQLAIGGTAVGTGLNTHPEFPERMVSALSGETGLKFKVADNHFEALASRDAIVEASAALKTVAISLAKIANDVRWLASGPRCGIGEISIPATQPGSSIMPGKVNPVMSESVLQVAAKVIGNDATITTGGLIGGVFELNVMKPVLAYTVLESCEIIASVARAFADKCVAGIEANRERCQELIEYSLAMCTALAPKIGYDEAASIAKKAFAEGRTVREVALETTKLTKEELDHLLDPKSQTERGIPST